MKIPTRHEGATKYNPGRSPDAARVQHGERRGRREPKEAQRALLEEIGSGFRRISLLALGPRRHAADVEARSETATARVQSFGRLRVENNYQRTSRRAAKKKPRGPRSRSPGWGARRRAPVCPLNQHRRRSTGGGGHFDKRRRRASTVSIIPHRRPTGTEHHPPVPGRLNQVPKIKARSVTPN